MNPLGFGEGSGFDSFLQQQEQSTPQPQLHRLAGFAVEAQIADTIGRLANCHISVAQMMTDILTMILTGISYIVEVPAANGADFVTRALPDTCGHEHRGLYVLIGVEFAR